MTQANRNIWRHSMADRSRIIQFCERDFSEKKCCPAVAALLTPAPSSSSSTLSFSVCLFHPP